MIVAASQRRYVSKVTFPHMTEETQPAPTGGETATKQKTHCIFVNGEAGGKDYKKLAKGQ
jgi:hypothetical protein